jgi:hypothetical protein
MRSKTATKRWHSKKHPRNTKTNEALSAPVAPIAPPDVLGVSGLRSVYSTDCHQVLVNDTCANLFGHSSWTTVARRSAASFAVWSKKFSYSSASAWP